MTTYRFPYSRVSRQSDNALLQFKNEPLLTIGLLNKPDRMVKVLAYIDTGSQWCLFHNQYAAQLDIKDYKNTKDCFSLSGIGGANANMAYFHDLTLLIFKDTKTLKAKNAIEISTKIGFVDKHFGNIPEHYFELKQMF